MEKPEDATAAKCIWELMEAVDSYIPTPPRPVDKPYLMPIEDIFTITGRGTVVTGRVERGIVKVGDEVEVGGFRETRKTVVTGGEMLRKLLDEGRVGGRGVGGGGGGGGGGTRGGGGGGGGTRRGGRGGRCWRSRGVSRRKRSSRRRGTCWGRRGGGGTRRFSMGIGRSFIFGRRT